MSDSSIKQSDISDFLKYLIELGGMYKVDESNYVLMRTIVNDEVIYKPEMVKNGETTAPLSCYHEKDTPIGSIIVNPFREGSVDTVDKKWFYTTKTIIVSGLLSSIIKTIIEDVLECKNKKKKEDIETSSLSHAELISKFVDIVDDKLVEEFKTISSNIKGFANIFYLTNKREAKFRVGVYDTSFRDQFKRNVRQKSWTIFENIVNTVLDTTPDMTEFICKPTDHMGAPKFEAYLKVLFVILSKLDKYRYILDLPSFELDTFKKHLEHFKEYQEKAKNWMVQPISTISNKETVTNTKPVWDTTHAWSKNDTVPVWARSYTQETQNVIKVPEVIREVTRFTFGSNTLFSCENNETVATFPWLRNKLM